MATSHPAVDLTQYDFPFENIVFEGGGSKGLAYCGALYLFEELGILKKTKKLAGTSAGGITATMVNLGYSAHEIEEIAKNDLTTSLLMDGNAFWKKITSLPRLLQWYGLSSGTNFSEWLAEKFEGKGFDRDITFRELYMKTNIELCLLVTDLNSMHEIYCHVKTTPAMPVRTAVRMTMSIPGMFQPVEYQRSEGGNKNYYVDGGVLCNYPIHCFDGWWLSMAKEDSFLHKITDFDHLPFILSKKRRFGQKNEKTIGFVVYSDEEADYFRAYLEEQAGEFEDNVDNPKTQEEIDAVNEEKARAPTLVALNKFLALLRKHESAVESDVPGPEFLKLVEQMNKEDIKLLFRQETTPSKILEMLDVDHTGSISFTDVVEFVDKSGIDICQEALGYRRSDISSLYTFGTTLLDTMQMNLKRLFMEANDLSRTVGINTGNVTTADFDVAEADVKFVLKKGRFSTQVFLERYVKKHNLPKKN